MKLPVKAIASCAAILSAFSAYASCPDIKEQPSPTRYPTEVVVDYALGCMLANGTSPDALRRCSCSIDFIAESIPYDEYEKVETLLRLQQMPGAGGRGAFYKESNWAKDAVAHLREVQAESTLRCF